MTFWQENYAFIKDVYDARAEKMVELMDKTDKCIAEVVKDIIYTSAQFKKVKENFVSSARNLEQPETAEWLTKTRDTLMSEKTSKEKDEESKKLKALLERYEALIPKIADTKNVVDCLWKSYQFTDDLAPLMEWLEDMVSRSSRSINTNNASQTEEHIEKQEKTLDQLDKKRKAVLEQQSKGEKILSDPKSPVFLKGHLDKLKTLWNDANKTAEDRLQDLKDNLAAWEKYEFQRDDLRNKLDAADAEFKDTKKVFSLNDGPVDHATRTKTADSMRKDIEATFKVVKDNNDILQKLLEDDKKAELNDEINGLKERMQVLDRMDEKLKALNEFNAGIKVFDGSLKVLEDWLSEGRKRMDELLRPGESMEPQERVMATMELQSDVDVQLAKIVEAREEWEKLKPTEDGEDTPEAKSFVERQSNVSEILTNLNAEVKTEGAKFGEDVKYLADFTTGCKRVDPWIVKAEAKKALGMPRPNNLEEAKDIFEETKTWYEDSKANDSILEQAYESAKKMTLHEDSDAKYKGLKERLVSVQTVAKEWIVKYEEMIKVWEKQADTAAKVSAAISAKPGESGGSEMKLEDLEKHLDTLKQMFIEKQKMMEGLSKETAKAAVGETADPPPA